MGMQLKYRQITPSSRGLAAALIVLLFSFCSAYAAELEKLTIYVPGSKGGGFDKVAMAIKHSLITEGLADNVELIHSPGAGGIISLASFVRDNHGNEDVVFLGGRTNIGASVFNRSQVSLSDTQPVARLIGPSIVIAVSNNSPIKDLSDLISVYRSNPEAVKWVGGSVGSQDELLLLELSQTLGINRSEIIYQSIPGGGGDIITEVVQGRANVLFSSYEEIKDELPSGSLRIIAIVPESANSDYDVASFSRYNVVLSGNDWKGIFAPKNADSGAIYGLETLFQTMTQSGSWKAQLEENYWQDLYLPSDEFSKFVQSETESITSFLANYDARSPAKDHVSGILADQFKWLILALLFIILLLGFLVLQRYFAKRRESELERSLVSAEGELERKLEGSRNYINDKLTSWKLTESETEIGWLLLKGLSFKEIAAARGTSERTVRQQARAVYAKSGLSSRSDLSAYFLEDFVFGQT